MTSAAECVINHYLNDLQGVHEVMARVAAGPSSEERRQQSIAAARCVFARKGFLGPTNQDIALAAGVTPGLLYHYFADKRALRGSLDGAYAPRRRQRAARG